VGIGGRPGGSGRPSQDDLQNFLDLPGSGSTRPNLPSRGDGDRVGIGGGDRGNIGNRVDVGDRVNTGDRVNIGTGGRNKVGDVNINTGDINVGNRVNRENNVNSIRNRWTNVDNRPFDRNWWGGRDYIRNDPHWRWQRGWAGYGSNWCWRPCTWAAFGGWFAWNWTKPYAYNYGTNVVYRDNYVYINDQQYATTDAYYQQAETIAGNVPAEVEEEQIEWMPLGVFAIAEENATDSGMMVQLAVSKEGILAGTFYNSTTDSTRPLQGTVDQTSQRAAWKFADGENSEIVMETGIYNLTEDEATALVHFSPDQWQSWLMVRLPEPEGEN
jgi:hypothetical protein